jgi:hypothetical protein
MAAQESLLRCETARRVVVVLLPSQTVLADDLFLAKRQAEFELYPFEWHFAEVGRQMPNRITVLLVVVATTALITAAMAGSLRQDTFRDASAAFQRRDYSTAFQKFKMLADRGDPIAQDFLATMYSNGWGVRKSEVEGIKWYRRAAAQGFPHAQIMLAMDYSTGGPGIPQDFVLSYMWFSLAAAHASKLADDAGKSADESGGRGYREYKEIADDATRLRNNTTAFMTREQIAEAQKFVREWQPVFEEGYVRDLQNEKHSGED